MPVNQRLGKQINPPYIAFHRDAPGRFHNVQTVIKREWMLANVLVNIKHQSGQLKNRNFKADCFIPGSIETALFAVMEKAELDRLDDYFFIQS
jgi:hypothetical protein